MTAAIALELVYDNGQGFGTETFQLHCDPLSGTLPDPAAACSAIANDPQLVLSGPGTDHSCPAFTPGVDVRGTYNGQQVDVAFSGCLSGQDDSIGRWIALLGAQQQNRVRLDRGLGPLSLGEKASVVHTLLGPAQTTLSGVEVYRLNWAAGFNETIPAVYGVGYNAGRVVTLISNSIELTVYGQHRVALLTEPRGTRRGLRAHGPLNGWLRIKCDGVGALADHILRYATTIIRRAVDHPLVIVTSRPVRACAAATRIARLVRPPLPATTASRRPRTSAARRSP
jgi:hypothetical protein